MVLFARLPCRVNGHMNLILEQVDGGCGVANIKEIAEAGADMFVAGSAIFNNPRTEENYKETIDKMRSELSSATIA